MFNIVIFLFTILHITYACLRQFHPAVFFRRCRRSWSAAFRRFERKVITPHCNTETLYQIFNHDNPDSVRVLSLLPRQTPELACPAKGHPTVWGNRNFESPGLQQQPSPHSPNKALPDGPPLSCDKHGLLNIPLTCAGPEVIYNGLITVANCIAGKRFPHSNSIPTPISLIIWLTAQSFIAGIHHTSVPTRGRLSGSNQVTKYCCAVFWADVSFLFVSFF